MGWLAAAIVFVALLYFFPRWVGYGLIVLLVVAVGAGAYWGLQEYEKNKAANKVQATLQLGNSICRNPGYPIFAGFVNGSNKTVNSIHYSIDVKKKGYSNIVATLPLLKSDKILAPGEGIAYCYAIPDLKEPISNDDLVLELSYKSVYFQQ